ncbi:MAG: hypothetical protein MJK04_18375 [Psychrosphaera sp.]|nr:hypothetical protein [Psychrosphaera sp.]
MNKMNSTIRIATTFATTVATTALFLLLSGQTIADTLTIGVIEYPPHINFKQDTAKNRAVTYIRRALKEQYDTIEFIKLPSKRAKIQLNKGAIDLLFPLADPKNQFKHLSKPLFNAIPGLCFKKKAFIPILSATHRLKGLTIGIPASTKVVATLKNSGAKLKTIEGSNTLDTGINLLLDDLIDVLYHPSPVKVYHQSNPLAKKIACSYFYGQSWGVYIAATPKMSARRFQSIDEAFSKALKSKSYEFYFAER